MSRNHVTVTLTLAGLTWTAGQAVLPDMGRDPAERYDRVADAPGLESLSGGLLVLAGVLMVLGAVMASRRLATLAPARGGRALATGTALLALGGVWLVGGRGAFNLMFVRIADPDNVARSDALRLLDASPGAGFAPLLLTLPCLLLGPVVLGVGLRRAGLAGWWPLGLWVVGLAAFIGTEFTVKPAEVLGIATAAVALAWIGLSIDRATGATPTEQSVHDLRARRKAPQREHA
jgi:hypothetical protein